MNTMITLIYRQLVYEPFRTGLTCVAIASAIAVILLLEGFQSGLVVQLEKVAVNRGADLIVTQAGVTNFIGSRSLLPQLSRQKIESIDGVREAHPITMVPVIYEQDGYRKSPIFFVVYDIQGGPANIKEGHADKEPRGIVIDESLAVLYDLQVGDKFVIADFEFHISGIASEASALFTAFAFIDYDDMIDFYFDSDLVGDISNLPLLSYLLVEIDSGVDRNVIAEAIEELEPEADVFTPEQLSQNDGELGRTLFGPVMGVLIGVGYVIAVLVLGMIMFATVHARLRNFGVMKALGFPNHNLVKMVVLESVFMVLLAFPMAMLLAISGAWIIELRVPLYLVPVTETVPLLRTIAAAIVLGVVGAYLPYRLIAKLDPAFVFRA
jgi:putative ABC transport system permease protein